MKKKSLALEYKLNRHNEFKDIFKTNPIKHFCGEWRHRSEGGYSKINHCKIKARSYTLFYFLCRILS